MTKARKALESAEKKLSSLREQRQVAHSRKEDATQKLQIAQESELQELENSSRLAVEETTLNAS